jgi:dGTPase
MSSAVRSAVAGAEYHDYLAPYACLPQASKGRRVAEDEHSTRSPYQRDRDRIIHSTAFRRLEYKTQVFVNHVGDHFRTRLTHSLEVAQLARTMARHLRLNEDLAEALALAHDLGHTPFGHAGEDALVEVMKPYGGFDHNAQAIRILTKLEQRYADFDGLNLSWETLEGIAKHNGPVAHVPRALAEYNATHDLHLHTYASAEAQLAALADDIAYNTHDFDDGLRAKLFTIEELEELPLIGDVIADVRMKYAGRQLTLEQIAHESLRRFMDRMVKDLFAESTKRLAASGVNTVDDIRAQSAPVISFSDEMLALNRELKAFLMKRMYRHYTVNRMTSKARRLLKELFGFYMAEPNCLPPRWQAQEEAAADDAARAVVICDFIAGMTDRFAMQEHRRVFALDE